MGAGELERFLVEQVRNGVLDTFGLGEVALQLHVGDGVEDFLCIASAAHGIEVSADASKGGDTGLNA